MFKLENIEREQMGTGQFLDTMGTTFRHPSQADEMGAPFLLHPTLSIQDWRTAQKWLRDVGIELIFANKSNTGFMVPSTLFRFKAPSKEEMRAQLARWKQKETPIKGEDFHAYTFRMGSFYSLKVVRGQAVLTPELILSCSCPFYAKKHKCKHCLGVSIDMKFFPVPIGMSLERIGVYNPDGTLKRWHKRLAPTQTNSGRALKNQSLVI
jgi:hypothetical protein